MSSGKDRALKSIFKGGMIVLAGTIISKFFGLLYRVLVGRYLGPEEYGVISVMVAVYAVASQIGAVGIPQGVQKFMASYRGEEDMEGVRGTLRTGLIIATVPSVLMGVGVYLAAPWLVENVFHEPRALWPVRMVAVIIPLSVHTSILSNVADAFEQMQYNVYVNNIWANVSRVAIAAVLVWASYGYIGASFAYAFSMGSGIILAAYYARKLIPGLFSHVAPAKYDFSELFHFSWPLLAAGLFGIVLGHIDTFMLQFFSGSREVGLYQAAYPFANLLTIGIGLFASIFLSNASRMIAEGDLEELDSVYQTVTKWVALVSLPIFAVFMAFPRAVLVIFGSEYYVVDDVLRVLSFGFLLGAISGPFRNIFKATDRTKVIFGLSAVLATLNAGLNWWLIPSMGAMGAAIASTTAQVVSAMIGLVIVSWKMEAFPFRLSILKAAVASSVAVGVVWWLSNFLFEVTPLWFFVIDMAVFGLIYVGLLLVLRVLEEEDLMILREIREKTGLELEIIEKIVHRFS